MTRILEKWKIEDEKYFVNTTASTHVMTCIQQHVCVSVIGPSGVGKTFLVHHVALEMKKKGYRVIKVVSPDEIKKYYRLDDRTLFLVDDMCGKFTAKKEELNKWKQIMNDITDLLDKDSCKLILTCRLQVFQDKEFDHSDFELFKTCICNLVERKLSLTDSEKQQLANMYFKNIDIYKLRNLFQYDFFPFLCKWYDRRDQTDFSEKEFIQNPFTFCEKELDNLLLDCKYKFVALLLLVLCNNHLKEKVLIRKEDQGMKILDHILEECPIEHFHIVYLQNELEALTRTFVVIENGTYHAMHDKLFDFLAYYFGTKYNRLLIKHADMHLINARCVIIDQDKSDKTTREEYLIAIEDDNLQLYTERVFNDMKKENNEWGLLRSNRNKYHEMFQNTLCAIIQKLKKDEISNLIETSSSVFVREMFVMDENDIKSKRAFPYGIILQHNHLEKYIERMFIDMTKSDNVEFYLEKCRGFMNEVLSTNLLTYMESLRPNEIKELIKSANKSFVQLMFVIEKDDIKPISLHVYKRFGIVIHCDVIQVYIKRVFDDMTRSDGVNEYLICNRNSRKTKFHTVLLDYMTQLDRTTIEHLIKNAGRSFIYELCVMTTNDINEISYTECKRYGVIIPDECIQMYVDRLFDEMTKSKNISTHFEKNRNGKTNKFKTALQTYITELREENIEKLIKTASKDFLHKLFVTTKEDIIHDSINDYEQYGIVLPDKYLDMYTEIILDSYRFIEDFKCNRTMKCVLKLMSQFGESKITELIQESNETVFHQMITVDIANKFRSDKMYSDCQSDSIVKNMFEMEEGPIICPVSLLSLYMDRMISDWSKGEVYAVVKNKNLKNQYFVDKFLHHLNLLEPSKILKLVNIEDNLLRYTAFSMSCEESEVNLAKWCLEKHVYGNRGQKHNILFALFLLVVFDNQLEETIISEELIKITDEKFSFRQRLQIREDISAWEVKRELNNSFNRIGVDKKGVIYSVRYYNVFAFLVFYFASIQQMSKYLVEYADEKFLFEWFLIKKSSSDHYHFNIPLPDEELFTCTNRVFTKMTNCKEFMRNILKGDNKTNINSVTTYVRILNKKEKITIVEKSCIAFPITICAVTANETQYHSDGDSELYIVIPDEYIPIYIKRIFDYVAKSDCVEECLHGIRNKRSEIFHSKLLIHMNELNRDDVEKLIHKASSDFINRMLVISEDDIKPETCWEYERYGIVIPENLLQIYIERVFSDMTKSVYVPVNRNSENKTFRDNLHLYMNSLSEDKLASLIQTAGSKFISRMYLSSSGETAYISFPRIESSFIFVPKKYFQILKKILIVKGKMQKRSGFSLFTIKNDSTSYTIITRDCVHYDPVLIKILSKNRVESSKLKQHFIEYIDPLFTGKIIACCVNLTNGLVSKYIQRLSDDWMNGHVYDVFGNINLSNPSFQDKFLTHLRNTDHERRSKLARREDTSTKDLPMVVCSFVGISELAKWCLDNDADANSNNNDGINPLYIACVQNHPDIVSLLLNHTNKAHVNKFIPSLTLLSLLYAACAGCYEKIVLLLLEEDVEVNFGLNETPLYVACKNGYFKIVSMLLDKKADKIDINRLPIFSIKDNTPLYIACKKGHSKIVSFLLEHTADEVDVNKVTDEGETPLYAACKGGYRVIVDLLLARENRVINKSRIDGASPLFVACQEGHVEVVSTLLKHKIIEIDQCMLIGMSPLFIAALLGHTEIVRMLLEKMADASICVKNKKIVMQIFEKYKYKRRRTKTFVYEKYIKYIRQKVSENASEHVISYIDGKEEDCIFNSMFEASPLHMGSFIGHIKIVQLLAERSSNVNCFSENGSTPLFLACELGHEDIVNELLENGAYPTLNRKDGKSPLTIARENGHMRIVEIIIHSQLNH